MPPIMDKADDCSVQLLARNGLRRDARVWRSCDVEAPCGSSSWWLSRAAATRLQVSCEITSPSLYALNFTYVHVPVQQTAHEPVPRSPVVVEGLSICAQRLREPPVHAAATPLT